MHILALANSTPHRKRSAAHHLNEPWCQSRGEDEVVEGSRVSKAGRRDWVGVGRGMEVPLKFKLPRNFLPEVVKVLVIF